jgi:hypothetical protein
VSLANLPLPILGFLVVAIFAVFDISFPQEGDEIFETAGSRVRIRGGVLSLRPYLQDIFVAEVLCLILVWFGVFEISQASAHLAAAAGLQAPPLGGISLSRSAGHSLVGVSLLALGASGLFRAALTVGLHLDPEGAHIDQYMLGLFPHKRITYPRETLDDFLVRRSPRGERPLQLLLTRRGGEAPVRLLSLVPSVSRDAALEREMRHLATRLRQLVGRTGAPPAATSAPAVVPAGSTRLTPSDSAAPASAAPPRPRLEVEESHLPQAPRASTPRYRREGRRPARTAVLRSEKRSRARLKRNRRAARGRRSQ